MGDILEPTDVAEGEVITLDNAVTEGDEVVVETSTEEVQV